jgi:hypothetical protein
MSPRRLYRFVIHLRENLMTSNAEHLTFQGSEPASPNVSASSGTESVQAQSEDEVKSEKEAEEPVKAGEDGPTNLGEAREAAKVCQLLTWFMLYAYSHDRRERHQNSRLRELDCAIDSHSINLIHRRIHRRIFLE